MKKRFISAFAVILVVALLLCGFAGKDLYSAQSTSDTSGMLSSQLETSRDTSSEPQVNLTETSSDTSRINQDRWWNPAYPHYDNLVIKVGQKEQIGLSVVMLSDYAREVKVDWEISDESIATFAEEHNNCYFCEIIGLKPGVFTIGGQVTAPDGDGSFYYTITVVE